MSRLYTVREICERALRKIGSFAIRDTGADPEEMAEARHWLDMVVGHVAANQRCWWLVPETLSLALRADTASYDLIDALGASAPATGIQFPVSAYLRRYGEDTPIDIVRRADFEAIGDKDQAGTPSLVYIDRAQTPTAYLWPVPDDGNSTLRLVVQTFANDFTSGKAEQATNLRSAWNLFLVTSLAAQIGNGPVRKLPGGEVRDMKDEAERLLRDLWAYDNHEQPSAPRRTAFHDF